MSSGTSDQTRNGRRGSRIDRDRLNLGRKTWRQRSTTRASAAAATVGDRDAGRSVAAPLKIEHRFGFSEPFSIGVEEELFLVDPLTGEQRNTSSEVLERLGAVDGAVQQELHACEVELITNIHADAGDAVRALGEMRRAVLETGTGLLASGTHPTAREGDAAITPKERYQPHPPSPR